MAVFGFPKIIVSDNGPQFSSGEFSTFCKMNGIEYSPSPVYHPASNGLAERGVGTIKTNLKKYVLSKNVNDLSIQQQILNFLFKYRNTPVTSTQVTPSDLVFRYKPRTCFTYIQKEEGRNKCDEEELTKTNLYKEKKLNELKNFNAKPYFDLNVGERVLFLNPNNDFANWIPGRVRKRLSFVTYEIEVGGNIRKVHRNQIRKFGKEVSVPGSYKKTCESVEGSVKNEPNEDVPKNNQNQEDSLVSRKLPLRNNKYKAYKKYF